MKFVEAFDLIKLGKKVKRHNWPDNSFIALDKSKGEGYYNLVDEKQEKRNLCYYNLIAEDWELVKKPNLDPIESELLKLSEEELKKKKSFIEGVLTGKALNTLMG